jgi:DNA ligase-1
MDRTAPAAMIARSYDGCEVAGFIASEKLDGVFARWDGARLVSRDGVVLAAPAWFTAGLPAGVLLDGELWTRRGDFDRASGIARSHGGDWSALRFMLFDAPSALPYSDRLRVVESIVTPYCCAVPTVALVDVRDLAERMVAVVNGGGEGMVVRAADSVYITDGHATSYRVKFYDDAEAVVVAHYAGGLMLSRDGVTFRVGSGLTRKQRACPPALGAVVTYRYDGLTGKGLPRFPRLVGVRHDVRVAA